MKTTSSKIFFFLFELSFVLFILGVISAAYLGTKHLIFNTEGHYTIGSFDSQLFPSRKEKVTINPEAKETVDAHMETGSWHLKLNSRDIRVTGFMAGVTALEITYIFIILYVLRKFVLSLKANQAFHIDNVKRLRILGVLILLVEPLELVLKYVMHGWLKNFVLFEFPEKSVAYKIGYSFGSGGFLWNWILTGLLILVIAEVFKQGLIMKEEQDLTI